jgi:fibronectin-binding autotransporter adhesin
MMTGEGWHGRPTRFRVSHVARTTRLASWAAALALVGLFALPAAASAGTCTLSGSTDWNTAGNWTCSDTPTNRVPTAGDDVVIPNGKNAILSTGANGTANSIDLQSGGHLEVGGGKTLTSDGGAASTFAGTGTTVEVLDSGSVLHLAGNTTWSSGDWSVGGTRYGTGNGGTVENAGMFTISGNVTANNSGSGQIHNLGGATLQRTTSEGTATLNPGLDNDGQVTVNTGTLNLGGGAGTSFGDYTVAAGKTLGFTGGTHTVGGVSAGDGSINGAGTVRFGLANVFVEGTATYNVPGETLLSDGRLDLAASVTGATGRLTSDGAFMATRSGAGTLNVGMGVSIIDQLTFAGKGTTNYASGATINAAGTGTTLEVLDAGTVVHLDGTTTWSSGVWSIGGTRFGGPNGGTIENAGTFTISGDVTANNAGGGQIHNLGGATLQRTTSEGTATLFPGLDNDGQVTVNTGTLNLGGGAGTSLGDYTVAAGKTLGFTGGVHTIAGNPGEGSISGDGTVRIGGASVFLSGSATYNVPGETLLSNGRMDLAASVTGTTGRLTSDGSDFAFGARTGPGTLNVGAGASNFDRITFGGGGTTNFAPGATIDATTGDINTTVEVLDAGTVVHLDGTTTWSSGVWSIGGTRFGGPNGGTVENAGTFTISGDVTANNAGGGQIHNLGGATLQRTTSEGTATLNTPVDNDGQLLIASGTLATPGGTTSSGSIVIQDSRVLDAGLNQVLLEAGGSLGGASDAAAPHPTVEGTLNNQAGTVGPGGSAGILSVDGSYTQGSGGTLATEIAGTTAGTQFDQLLVTGSATLDGTLAIQNQSGFTPALTDTFEVVSAGSLSGEFAQLTGAQLADRKYVDQYDADSALLAVEQTAAPTPTPSPTPTPQPPAGDQPGDLIVGGCLNADASVRGRQLGPARLGRGQAQQRAIFQGAKLATRQGLDKYCATGGGTFRIGYPTNKLLRRFRRSLQRAVRQRVVMILTSSRRFKLNAIVPGTTTTARARQRLRGERPEQVGKNTWLVARSGGVLLLVKTQGGRVREIGIGDARLRGRGRLGLRRFLTAWAAL